MKNNLCVYCNGVIKKECGKSLLFPKKNICENCSKIEYTLNKRLKRGVPTFALILEIKTYIIQLLKRKALYKGKRKPFSCPICGKRVENKDAYNSIFINETTVCKECNDLEMKLKHFMIKINKDDKWLIDSIAELLVTHFLS